MKQTPPGILSSTDVLDRVDRWSPTRERLVLHASYPKTGSTMLADILRRLALNPATHEIEQFTLLHNSNNFAIRATREAVTIVLKTHDTFGDWRRALWKYHEQRPDEAALVERYLPFDKDCFASPRVQFVYVIRNPINVLLSAIRYAKVLLRGANLLPIWVADGRAARFFVELLGYADVPAVGEFEHFSPLDLSERRLETLLWTFLEADGSIPIFDYEGTPTYFQHVNYYHQLLAGGVAQGVMLEYENLMAGNDEALTTLADAWQMESSLVRDCWEGATRIAAEKSRRYLSFYGDLNVSTPPRVTKLASWPEMRRHVAAACPPLAGVCA